MASGSPPSGRDRSSEDVFRDLIEGLDAFNYVVRMDRPDDVRIYVNSVTEQALALNRGDLKISQATLHRYTHHDDSEMVRRRLAEAQTAGGFEMEYRLLPPNGYVKWIRHTARMTPAEGHRPSLWFGYVCDVTRERLDYDALRRSERKYRDLVEQLPAIIYVDSNDEQTTSLYVSPEVETLIGNTPAERVQDGFWHSTLHPDDRERVLEQWSRAVATAAPFGSEYRYVHKKGHSLWVRDTATPVRDSQGRVSFWQGVIQDIGDRKRAEEDLRHSESRFRALVELVPAVVYEMGPDDERRTLYVSPHVQQILGYTRQEWLDQPDIWVELLHPDDREIELAAHDELSQTHEPWLREYRLIASDGRVVWVRDQGQLAKDAFGSETWHGVMLDITAEKRAEDALKQAKDDLEFRVMARTTELEEANEMMSLEIGERRRVEAELRAAETRFRLLVEQLPAAVYIRDVGSTERGEDSQEYMSPQIEQLLGYTPTEWTEGALWRERVHPHDREPIFQVADRTARTGANYTQEYRYLAKDGRVVWVIDQVRLLERDEQGRPRLLQGVLLDITHRREAEGKVAEIEEIRASHALLDGIPAITWTRLADGDGRPARLTYVAAQATSWLGYSPEELLGDTDLGSKLLHPEDRATVMLQMAESAASGSLQVTNRVICKDGQIRWFHTSARRSKAEPGSPQMWQGVTVPLDPDLLPGSPHGWPDARDSTAPGVSPLE